MAAFHANTRQSRRNSSRLWIRRFDALNSGAEITGPPRREQSQACDRRLAHGLSRKLQTCILQSEYAAPKATPRSRLVETHPPFKAQPIARSTSDPVVAVDCRKLRHSE